MILTDQTLTLIAHRGYSARYPENTLLAYQAAYDCGARFVELDLQLTADCVPILHHDPTLKRMAGVDVNIFDTTSVELERYSAAYPQRFSDEFSTNTFTHFKIFCEWLKAHSDVIAFVEIKQESIDHFDLITVMESIFKEIVGTSTQSQCIIIAFNQLVVEYTQKNSTLMTGWVLPAWSDKQQLVLRCLQPAFVFCDVRILPANDKEIWRGNWEWAVYNLDDIESAIAMVNRGILLLETNEIDTLANSESLLAAATVNPAVL